LDAEKLSVTIKAEFSSGTMILFKICSNHNHPIKAWFQTALFMLLFLIPTAAFGIPSRSGPPCVIENATTVIDQAGRRIRGNKPFTRIVSLYGAHTENLFRIGAGKAVIGGTRHEVYPPEATTLPAFSYHDDPEKFLAARPDLVLIRPMIDRAYPQLMTRLEKSGITVCSLQPKTADDLYTYWEILGILTGNRARALHMTRRFHTALQQFRELGQSVSHPKRVYFEAIHHRMKTFMPHSMAIFALETAGGIHIAPDAIASRDTNIGNYGKEHILAHAAEIDVFLAQVGVMNQVTKTMIRNEPGFSAIKAVQTNQIYLIDEMIVSRPSFRLLQGIHTIGRLLYPTVFNEKADLVMQKARNTGQDDIDFPDIESKNRTN
jgi:iron complex transport system substrate-binding protein